MDKIYLVTAGSYSDYRVEAVFDSEAKANSFADYYNKSDSNWDKAMTEEYILNEHYDKLSNGYDYFFIRMGVNGNVKSIELDTPSSWDDDNIGTDIHDNYIMHVWGRDKDHAIKIANERRIQHKAQENG